MMGVCMSTILLKSWQRRGGNQSTPSSSRADIGNLHISASQARGHCCTHREFDISKRLRTAIELSGLVATLKNKLTRSRRQYVYSSGNPRKTRHFLRILPIFINSSWHYDKQSFVDFSTKLTRRTLVTRGSTSDSSADFARSRFLFAHHQEFKHASSNDSTGFLRILPKLSGNLWWNFL